MSNLHTYLDVMIVDKYALVSHRDVRITSFFGEMWPEPILSSLAVLRNEQL